MDRETLQPRSIQQNIDLLLAELHDDRPFETRTVPGRVLNGLGNSDHQVDVATPGSVINAGSEETDLGFFAKYFRGGRLDDINFVLIQTHSSVVEDLIECVGGEDPGYPGIQLFVTGLLQALIDPGGKLSKLYIYLPSESTSYPLLDAAIYPLFHKGFTSRCIFVFIFKQVLHRIGKKHLIKPLRNL